MARLLGFLITSMVLGAAQAPTDTAFYAVSYVEVVPGAKTTAVAALYQYREASRKDEGFVRFEFFEQAGRSGHLAVLETWANQKAFDAHQTAAPSKEIRSKLDPIRLSDYDQRPYKVLSVGAQAASPASDRTYVITHVDIGGLQTNASELLKGLAEASRKEAGNSRFDVLQHAMRANHFTVVETWQDEKARDAHAAAAHTKQYRNALGPMAGSPLDERIYNRIE
jgi:quinol monooxygenase YgiN